jgi:UDP-3-O-[3-hydroxymyristoyl] glucosamine N-acyltransferase
MAYPLTKPFNSSELAQRLGCEHRGQARQIIAIASSNDSRAGVLCFLAGPGSHVSMGAVAIGQDSLEFSASASHIVSANPRLDFMRALNILDASGAISAPVGDAVIHPTAKLGNNVVIEPGCEVGADVIIEHNVVLHSGTRVGASSRIRANASIGGDGFGFERDDEGRPIRFIHLGGVLIGRNVEIGSNTCVCRGTLEDTVIEDDAKIDNLVHVAHNCRIGRGALIIACAEISGGVSVGLGAWVGPNASILQKLKIGDGALIGLGAVVTKDVPERAVVAGNPARVLRILGAPR